MRKPKAPLYVVALLDKRLSAIEYRMFMLVRHYQGRNDFAWPSQETIAADLGLTPDGVRKITRRLADKGWLRVEYPDHTAPGRGVQYSITHPANHPDSRMGEHPDSGAGITQTGSRAIRRTRTRTQPQEQGAGRAISYSAAFERFWGIYPKREGKRAAWRAWQQLNPAPELVGEILASVEAHSKSAQWTRSLAENGGQFVPKPANFLREAPWEDDPIVRPEPQPGDPDYVPDSDSPQLDALFASVRKEISRETA